MVRSSCWPYSSLGVLSGSVSGDYSTRLALGRGGGGMAEVKDNRGTWRPLCRSKYIDREVGNEAKLELYSGAGYQRRKQRSPLWFQHASFI